VFVKGKPSGRIYGVVAGPLFALKNHPEITGVELGVDNEQLKLRLSASRFGWLNDVSS
jgi:hypothetical protein